MDARAVHHCAPLPTPLPSSLSRHRVIVALRGFPPSCLPPPPLPLHAMTLSRRSWLIAASHRVQTMATVGCAVAIVIDVVVCRAVAIVVDIVVRRAVAIRHAVAIIIVDIAVRCAVAIVVDIVVRCVFVIVVLVVVVVVVLVVAPLQSSSMSSSIARSPSS
jgi:hypothetical protein